jgi:hypothetical protein
MSTYDTNRGELHLLVPPTFLPGPDVLPCPELMTEEEAIRYLRLDLIRTQNPGETLAYYRRKGLLKATQVGKCVRYRRVEIERFLELVTEQNPR